MIKLCCELLSNFVSLTSETTSSLSICALRPLWIAFKFCIFDIWNNSYYRTRKTAVVVNCFQILYLWHLKQHQCLRRYRSVCCELLSNFVSLTSETTGTPNRATYLRLWIAFKFCIFDIWNNTQGQLDRTMVLWIAFKFCIFDIWNNGKTAQTTKVMLWIAFKFCIFDIWNNTSSLNKGLNVVVNCFQILYLWHLKQQPNENIKQWISCELLSNFVSLTSETT